MTAILYSYSGLGTCRRRPRRVSPFRRKVAILRGCVLVIAVFFAVNLVYQVVRKPGELFAPISGSLSKSPSSTWRSYGALFEKHSTSIISPAFLAALAQVESDGNPVARTYWRWQWSWNPFEIYRPASSALGMFQMTDGTFAEARKLCVRNNTVAREGSWHDPNGCWLNGLYTRVLPSHAVEMTAAYLHDRVVAALAVRPRTGTSTAQMHRLAAVIHLCGPGRGATFVRRGFRAMPGERCGTHGLQRYLRRVETMQKRFAELAKK